ncbi:hypothetical protein J3459_010230 [Metarhizium acridum]|nr:hypothetical protein J3459_010230 [Metarhizium acridum]
MPQSALHSSTRCVTTNHKQSEYRNPGNLSIVRRKYYTMLRWKRVEVLAMFRSRFRSPKHQAYNDGPAPKPMGLTTSHMLAATSTLTLTVHIIPCPSHVSCSPVPSRRLAPPHWTIQCFALS